MFVNNTPAWRRHDLQLRKAYCPLHSPPRKRSELTPEVLGTYSPEHFWGGFHMSAGQLRPTSCNPSKGTQYIWSDLWRAISANAARSSQRLGPPLARADFGPPSARLGPVSIKCGDFDCDVGAVQTGGSNEDYATRNLPATSRQVTPCDPGELWICQTCPKQMSNNRSGSPDSTQIRPNIDLKWLMLANRWSTIDQLWPALAHLWPSSTHAGQFWITCGQHLASLRYFLPTSGRSWPDVGRPWPCLAPIRPSWAEVRQVLAKFGQVWPLWRISARFGEIWPRNGPSRPSLAELGPLPEQLFDNCSATFGRAHTTSTKTRQHPPLSKQVFAWEVVGEVAALLHRTKTGPHSPRTCHISVPSLF